MPNDDVRHSPSDSLGSAHRRPLPPSGRASDTTAAIRRGARFAPLVETYATVPYADLNPSLVAGLAYVAMFGMMFADVGHGALLVAAAVAIRMNWWSRLASLHKVWLFIAGAGAASICLVCFMANSSAPRTWCRWCGYHRSIIRWPCLVQRSPSVRFCLPVHTRLAASTDSGRAAGTAQPTRHRGWQAPHFFLDSASLRPVSMQKLAGLSSSVALWRLLVWPSIRAVRVGGGAEQERPGRIQLFDLVVRLGANLVSFARLAAFGLTHAALAGVVWLATVSGWHRGGFGIPAAIAIFVIGTGWRSPGGLVAGSRRCGWSTTSFSPESSTARDGRSSHGTSPGQDGGVMLIWLIALPAFAASTVLPAG